MKLDTRIDWKQYKLCAQFLKSSKAEQAIQEPMIKQAQSFLQLQQKDTQASAIIPTKVPGKYNFYNLDNLEIILRHIGGDQEGSQFVYITNFL